MKGKNVLNPNNYGRVYKKWTTSKLLRFKLFLNVVRIPLVTKNLFSIYNLAGKVFGAENVNYLANKIFGDILLGGKNEDELYNTMSALKSQGLYSIGDYSIEFLNEGEEHTIPSIVEKFKKCINVSVENHKENMIAIKLSSMIPITSLKKLNRIQHYLQILEKGRNKSFKELENEIKTYDLSEISKINRQNYQSFFDELDKIFKNSENISQEYKYNLVQFIQENFEENGISEEAFNSLNSIMNIDEEFKILSKNSYVLSKSTFEIFEHAEKFNSNVLVDAEQTYTQVFIDYAVAYYTLKYNKNYAVVMQTIQHYLKNSLEVLASYRSFVKENNVKLGMKLVRGAYMYEEKRLSEKNGYPNPVNETQVETNNCYNDSIIKCYKHADSGDRVIVATHNVESLELLKNLITDTLNEDSSKKELIRECIRSAQLIGLGYHCTWISLNELVSFF